MSKSRSKINIAARLLVLLVMIMSASWLFNQPSHSVAKDIFSKDRNGYFTGTHATEYHNVLPPIYNYNEYLGAKTPTAYAINVNELLDEIGLTTLKSNWRNTAVAMEIVNVKDFLDKMNKNKDDLIGHLDDLSRDYSASYNVYSKKYDQGLFSPSKNPNWKGINHAELCVHNMARKWDGSNLNPAKIPASKDDKIFIQRIDECKKWAETGYDFIKYSLAGVPQHLAIEDKKNGNYNHYNRYEKELFANAKNIKMTLQYMPAGGRVNLPNQNAVSPGQNPFNTAARKGYDDVLKYPGGIKESMAIVAWNMENGKPKSARWTLRLRCANPTTADLAVRNVENPIEVSGRVVSNKISTAGTAEVEFRYSIAKTVANFPANAKTPIQYQFSGTPQAGFNHGNLEITGSSGASGFNVGQRLGSNPAIFDTDIRGGKVEFVEKYTINAKANNADVTNIAGGSKTYVVCRTIQTQAAQGRPHNFTAAEVKKLKHDARACVRVSEQNDAANTEGSIDVLGFEPFMTPIAEIVNPGRGGINTRVLRPKQWVPQTSSSSATDNSCHPQPMGAVERLTEYCERKCRPGKAEPGKGYVWAPAPQYCWSEEECDSDGDCWEYEHCRHEQSTRESVCSHNIPREGRWQEIVYTEGGLNQERRTYFWEDGGSCGRDEDDYSRGTLWRKMYTAEHLVYNGSWGTTNNDNIECELTITNSVDWGGNCGRNHVGCCPSGTTYTGRCDWKKRTPRADWAVTRIIFKPENGSGNQSPEKGGLPPLNNEEKTLDSAESPLKYYCNSNGPVKKPNVECEIVKQGNNEIDNTSVFNLEAPGWNKHGLPSGMTWPYMPMNIVINPAGTDNYYYKTPPSAEGRFKSNILGGIDKSSPGIADADANIVPELPTGTVVCYGLSMTPWKIDQPGRWAHSQPKCYVVSKKPYFAVENGMVVSNGQIRTKTSKRSSGRTVGSWAEYNAIANGSIDELFSTNLGSFNGVLTNSNQWHKLTFQNTGSLGSFGSDPTTELIDQVRFFTELGNGRYAGTVVYQHGSNQQNVNNLGEGIHVFNGNTKITGSVGVAGRTVIVVDGDLTIAEGVGSVNAWVIVSGRLSTSDRQLTESEVARGLNGAQQLVINGPVRAQSISLLRTYGSGRWSSSNNLGKNRVTGEYGSEQFTQPAEIFRDTAETYIWSYENSVDKGRVQTVYLREVAPRY